MDVFALEHYTSHEVDRTKSKELNRLIQDKKRKKLVLHSLLHTKCKSCAASFNTKGCRNCCLPICNNLTKINTKKLLKDASIHNVTGRVNPKYCESLKRSSPLLLTVEDSHLKSSKSNPNLASISRETTPVNLDKIDVNKLQIEKMNLQDTKDTLSSNPSAPCLGFALFNNEEQSDIVFMVGSENDLWRFPAHSVILLEASPFFKNILNECDKNNNRHNIRIDWCNPTSFQTVLKYIYTKEICLKSINFALSIFNASNGLQISDLSIMCLTYLSTNCTWENVLQVLTFFNNYLRLVFANDADKKAFNEKMQNDEVLDNLNDVILKCYNIVDQFIETIIPTEEFGNLDWDLLEKLFSRSTLNISSELVIFDAINQWACQECKRMRKQLSFANKREVLGSLIYYPRYLTLTLEEYTKGPYQCDLLPGEEKQLFLTLLKSSSIDLGKLDKKYQFFKLAEKRKYENITDDDFYIEDIDEEDEHEEQIDDNEAEKRRREDLVLAQNLRSKLKRNLDDLNNAKKKKKAKSKRIINRLGDIAICMFKVLD